MYIFYILLGILGILYVLLVDMWLCTNYSVVIYVLFI